MNKYYNILKEKYGDIDIKYHSSFGVLVIKCKNIEEQLNDMKKIVKTLIFGIQSKEINKNSIIIDINDENFIKDDIITLLDIMKFTKTSHYFNIVVKNAENSRVKFIKDKYKGIKINEGI